MKIEAARYERLSGMVRIKGLTKHEVMEELGQAFNDMNSNVWRYHISDVKVWPFRYVYVHFEQNMVDKLMFSVLKVELD